MTLTCTDRSKYDAALKELLIYRDAGNPIEMMEVLVTHIQDNLTFLPPETIDQMFLLPRLLAAIAQVPMAA